MAGAIIVLLLAAASIAAPLLTDYSPTTGRLADARQPPSREHWFGVDQVGRDVFARVLYGGRTSLGISVVCVALSLLIGATIGTISAYAGGWFDVAVQRLVDIMLAFPGLLLALAIATALGRGVLPLIIAVVASSLPTYIRVVRSTVLSIKREPYAESARLLGASHGHIIRRHVLPNASTPMIVQSTLQLAGVLLVVASLSFLGLGLPPPTPDWGGMVADGRAFMRTASHMIWFPGFALALAVLGFNFLGDGLRDALDVKDAR